MILLELLLPANSIYSPTCIIVGSDHDEPFRQIKRQSIDPSTTITRSSSSSSTLLRQPGGRYGI
jgi:hypothetical protein